MTHDDILITAREEVAREEFRRLVDLEKARIREQMNMSLWQRLLNKLPFTIIWRV